MRNLDIVAVMLTLASCARTDNQDPSPALAGPEVPAVVDVVDPPKAGDAPLRGIVDVARGSEAPSALRVPIDDLPILGDANAPVTIVAFVDYEGPYCAKANDTLNQLRQSYGVDIRVALAMRPLPVHSRARAAARALLAAAEDGRAPSMHSLLFGTPHDDDGLRATARAAGLDPDRFDRARSGRRVHELLRISEELAASLHVTGAPTFFVNGRRLEGARTPDEFRAVIDEELSKARRLLREGIACDKVYDATMANASPPRADDPTRIAPNAVAVPTDGAPMRGPVRAPVTIVTFGDFECPFSLRMEDRLRALEEAYPGKLRIAYRQLPLRMHEHARLAAKAAVAADAQGRYWEYHDALFAHPDALDRTALERYAADLHLDTVRFGRDLDAPATNERIEAELAQARALHVDGTPTVFINGVRIDGAQTVATFRLAIDRALEAK